MDRRPTTRTSLACLPCRNQHLKCDSAQPSCARCRSLSRTCSYPESRRTGKYRASSSRRGDARRAASQGAFPTPTPTQSITSLLGDYEFLESVFNGPIQTTASGDRSHDALLSLYYERFHCSHPFVLPRAVLQEPLINETPNVQQLITVMQYIGSFYTDLATTGNSTMNFNTDAIDGFSVQTTLLLSLAKSMCCEQDTAEELLAKAIQQAKSIGMHTKAFADAAEVYNPVLAESWRRTWWMIYVVHLNYAVIRQDYTTTLSSADYDVDLPCEDQDYDSMDIPPGALSLQDYHSREFALEERQFSSFAYFIDATDIFVSSLRASLGFDDISEAQVLVDNLEATIAGWFIMLPADKRRLVVKSTPCLVDQLMFQAHMMMYTSITYIHRPLSTLRYEPAEHISSCGSPPRPLTSGVSIGSALDRTSHLDRLLQAVRKQNQCLIILPLGSAQLSPFIICMVACCTIAHLVAYKSALAPREADVARSRIRVCIGTLKHYEGIWPRARKILRELKSIACTILQPGQSPRAVEPTMPDVLDVEWLQSSGVW
ncbi:hypothetical protein VTI74DRAFT_1754 [Chaetomium olivicolor]